MIAPTAAAASPNVTDSPGPAATQGHALSFHDILSALNPLQYVPVIGTIYRAVTGDVVPEAVRRIGSLIASAFMGGPIGIAINLGALALEKASGIDLDQAGQALLRGQPIETALSATGTPKSADLPYVGAPQERQAWSPAQLAAYGSTTDPGGTLRLSDLEGADVLNSLELARIQTAHAAYARLAVPGI